jgi:hypothetical protein
VYEQQIYFYCEEEKWKVPIHEKQIQLMLLATAIPC